MKNTLAIFLIAIICHMAFEPMKAQQAQVPYNYYAKITLATEKSYSTAAHTDTFPAPSGTGSGGAYSGYWLGFSPYISTYFRAFDSANVAMHFDYLTRNDSTWHNFANDTIVFAAPTMYDTTVEYVLRSQLTDQLGAHLDVKVRERVQWLGSNEGVTNPKYTAWILWKP